MDIIDKYIGMSDPAEKRRILIEEAADEIMHEFKSMIENNVNGDIIVRMDRLRTTLAQDTFVLEPEKNLNKKR